MTLAVVWLPEAHAELREAFSHYESIRPQLAERFAAAVEETIARIAEGPLHYAVVDKEKRRAGIRKFPYGLFFSDGRHAHRDYCLLSRAAAPQTLAIALIGTLFIEAQGCNSQKTSPVVLRKSLIRSKSGRRSSL